MTFSIRRNLLRICVKCRGLKFHQEYRLLKLYKNPMHWHLTTLCICIYGIVKEFRPATPFLAPYLVSYKNFTLEEVYSNIYPYWTYSYMLSLVPVFILTDILRYKPIIVLEAACYVGTWALLVWGTTIWQMQLMQMFFGVASAAEIAYFSYMYAVVEEKNYKRVTSYIRTAALLGKLVAFASAQILISTGTGTFLLLNQMSLGAVTVVLFIGLALPGVPAIRADRQIQVRSLKDGESEENMEQLTRSEFERSKLQNGLKFYLISTLKCFKIYKKNKIILKWSIWWALASCGMYQVYNYIQALWLEMQPDPEKAENGWAEFFNTLIGAILSFTVQYLHINWKRYGAVTLCVSSILISGILFFLAKANEVLYGYIGYVMITSIYHMLITAASANIASALTSASYGLIFGWNTFVAVTLQTILTLSVADSHGLNLQIREQFIVYSGYFLVVGIIFCLFLLYSTLRRRKQSPSTAERVEETENIETTEEGA